MTIEVILSMMVFTHSDIGKKRSENQDSYATCDLEDAVFAVVCDGMGGQNAGREASARSVEIITERVMKGYRADLDPIRLRSLLIAAVRTANAVVYELGETIPECEGMGTTCVAALIRYNKAFVLNVGDSRAYLVTHEITQITKDHSMVQDMVDSGDITREEMRSHPKRNIITKAVGVDEDVMPDFFEKNFPDGASLILCSDGLYTSCDEGEMFRLIKEQDVANPAQALVQLALEDENSAENITAVVIK